MTVNEMKQIINEIPFHLLKKNSGIYEFHPEEELSIGISYEDD